MRQGEGVEIVEQGGDAGGVGLVHDRPGAAGGGDHVEAADALLDARDVARRHRQVAQAEAGGKQKRLNPIKLKQMKDRCQELEEEIARLEAAIATAETALQNFVSVEETRRQTDLLDRSRSELEQSMAEWETLSTALAD